MLITLCVSIAVLCGQANPLESALPNAPDLKLYCLYGVGKESERAYAYRNNSLHSDPLPFSLNTRY